VLGVRPEHLELGGAAGRGLTVRATVDVIEFLGNERLIHASTGDQDLVATVDVRDTLKVGERVVMTAPSARLYLFDPDSGLALSTRGAADPGRASVESI
jgi:ABC-type sugar transport system ATPase subunit